jgi:3-oxoacyl-[acyl-carrier-protein] synthase II
VAPDSSPRILVTGAGIVSPLGLNWQENEVSFRENRTAFRPVTQFDVSERIAKTAAQVDLPTERLFLKTPRHRQHLLDRGTQMLLLALRETLAMARLPGLQGIDAIIIGTSAGAMSIGQDYFRHAINNPTRQRGQISRLEYYQPQRQISAITEEYDWHGPIILVSNACASGANAIGDAMAMIQTGKAKRVLAGGYDALAELVFAGFDTLRALAPSGIPRPFDAARDGLALGEGAALVLLESEAAATERGADALAIAAGYSTATDLNHLTQPDPEGKAAIRTMNTACQRAGLAAADITYINSHGTGTPYNDVAEASAIKTWAGEAAGKIALSSTKSAMGHLLGGAGAVEAVICLMAMRGQWLPPSLGVREMDAAVSCDLVTNFREAPVAATLTNSFGFGGTNATVVFTPTTAAYTPSLPVIRTGPLHIIGTGAVSAAGWGTQALKEAVTQGANLPTAPALRAGRCPDWDCIIRPAPPAPADALPKFPRLRRASPISKFTMGAALQALAQAGYPKGQGVGRLGIIQLMFNGCVQFSGKFYQEVLETPTLASPLIFPETVYNAPVSHLAAYLGVDGPVSTLIGEASAIIEATQMAHTWLVQDLVDHVLVIGAEECDWLGAEAIHYYHAQLIASEGAGALLLSLKKTVDQPSLKLTTSPALAYCNRAEKVAQLSHLNQQPLYNQQQHITGRTGLPQVDQAEPPAGNNTEHHPRQILGETMGAAGALQLALAAAFAQETGQAVSVTLPGSLCAAYGAVVEP